MPAKIEIPLVFPGAPPELRRDLERLAIGVYDYSQRAAVDFQPRPAVSVPQVFNCAASFDVMLRVRPREGQTIVVQLPPVNSRNGGRRALVARMSTLGAIVLVPVGTTINGYDRILMTNDLQVMTVWFDGAEWLTDRHGCADPGEGL